MRSPYEGVIENAIFSYQDQTPKMLERMFMVRAFEWCVKLAHDQRRPDGSKYIQMPIYLSRGEEPIASSVATVIKPNAIFGQHRGHAIYLAFGGDPRALAAELIHRDDGCAGGMGGSASIHSPEIGMYGTDGFIGTNVPVGVGHAFSTRKPTVIFFGDAAAEEGYVLESLGWAAFKKLPILFVCVDNNMSVLTEVDVRRDWNIVDVASSFGMRSSEMTDDPWTVMFESDVVVDALPKLINVHTCRHWWHNGTGCDGPPEWDRMLLMQPMLEELDLLDQASELERETNFNMERVWLDLIPELDLTEWRDNR